ncbi:MAG: HEAT repeat domain-containing protein [Caldilineaceae bacterium]|nr:HEAT repeat domain-containing protein [Caldilineaceae bacterium]
MILEKENQKPHLPEAEALALLNDPLRSPYEREQGLHALAADPTPAHIERLLEALEDNQFGIRWTAAAALAEMGERALVPLLQLLIRQHDSVWLREGAYHICYYSSSPKVTAQTQALRKALRGPAAEVVTTDEAVKLLQQLL